MKEGITPAAKTRLRWFLSFLNVNINSLPRRDFLVLLLDLGEWWSPYIPKFPMADSDDMRQEIKGYQEHLKTILNILLNEEKAKQTAKPLAVIRMDQQVIRIEEKGFLVPAERKDGLLTAFFSPPEPLPLDRIRKCKRDDCRKYFLKATKKEKRYCSNNCAWIVASRKKRAANSKKKGK